MNQTSRQASVERLEKHPELWTQVAALLDEVENRAGTLGTADEAEEALIVRVRQLGWAGLTAWAQRRCAQLNAVAPAKARRGAKKTLVAEPFWGGGGGGAVLAARHGAAAALCHAGGGAVPRQFPAAPAGAD